MKKLLSIFVLLSVFAGLAHAGGLASATTAATTFKTWLYGFLGIVAFIYLMFKGVQAWAEKIQWFDFLTAIFKVAAVGGTLALVPWAWTMFA